MELFRFCFVEVPLLCFPKKKRMVETRKTLGMDIELVDMATIDAKTPVSSTPISLIPELNFLNLCDISCISLPGEVFSRTPMENTTSFDVVPVPKDARRFRLERVAALVCEMRLEQVYADKDDWLKDIDLDSLDYTLDEMSHHPYF